MAKSLEFEFRAKDSGVLSTMKAQGAGADEVKAKYKELEKAAKAAHKAEGESPADGNAGTLKTLKAGLGARSSLGQLSKLAVGGGAVAGLTFLADEIGRGADNAKKLVDQYKAGEISGGAMVQSLVEGIPIIGSFVSAGEKIKGLLASSDALSNSWYGKLTGLKEINDAEKINKSEAARKVLLDYQADAIERQKKGMRELADIVAKASRRSAIGGLDGWAREQAEANAGAADRIQALNDKKQAELDQSAQERKAKQQSLIDDKTLSPELRNDAEQNLYKEHNRQVAEINKRYATAETAEQAATAKEREQLWKKHTEAVALILEDGDKQISDSEANDRITTLRALGDNLSAEYELIAKNAADKKALIEKERKERIKGATNNEAYEYQQLANRQSAAVDNEAQTQRQAAIYKTLQESQLEGLQAQAAAGDYLATAELARVEAARKLNTESLALKAILADQTATLDQQTYARQQLATLQQAFAAANDKAIDDEHLVVLQAQADAGDKAAEAELQRLQAAKAYNEEAGKLRAILFDQTASVEQRKRAEEELRALTAAQGQSIDKALKDQTQNLFQQQSQYASTFGERLNAKKALEANKITQDFAEQQAKVQAILNNPLATADQKQKAVDNLKSFAELAGQNYDKDLYGTSEKQTSKLFDTQDRGLLLTGVAAAAQTKHDYTQDAAKNSADANKLLSDLVARAAAIEKTLGKPAGQLPGALSK